jgi:hypothetical protein
MTSTKITQRAFPCTRTSSTIKRPGGLRSCRSICHSIKTRPCCALSSARLRTPFIVSEASYSSWRRCRSQTEGLTTQYVRRVFNTRHNMYGVFLTHDTICKACFNQHNQHTTQYVKRVFNQQYVRRVFNQHTTQHVRRVFNQASHYGQLLREFPFISHKTVLPPHFQLSSLQRLIQNQVRLRK